MSAGTMASNDTTTIVLDGELTIYRAAELRATLRDALAAARGDVALDLADVTEFDSAGVQLLLAARKTALGAGRALHLVGPSAPVREVFDLLDLAPAFADGTPSTQPEGQRR